MIRAGLIIASFIKAYEDGEEYKYLCKWELMEDPVILSIIHEDMHPTADPEQRGKKLATACDFVNSHLTACEGKSIFNFERIFHCHFNDAIGHTGARITFIPFALGCLGICIYLLGITADVYLSPALTAISLKL